MLSDFLAEQGFDLMLTRSGAQALDKARLATPDLVLLDLRMPEMDGFEVCRRLKADAATADIPVIFMTAEDDIKAKVEGFALGAVDYITKPVQREELVARIQHHLQLHRLQHELTYKTEELSLKNTELEAYGHTIAHSLKTPLAAATRFLEILASTRRTTCRRSSAICSTRRRARFPPPAPPSTRCCCFPPWRSRASLCMRSTWAGWWRRR